MNQTMKDCLDVGGRCDRCPNNLLTSQECQVKYIPRIAHLLGIVPPPRPFTERQRPERACLRQGCDSCPTRGARRWGFCARCLALGWLAAGACCKCTGEAAA